MISQTVEYALRAVVTIAQNGGGPCTAHVISEITKVPAPYLSKLMQGLVRSGVLTSQRGLHGGFVLVRPAEQLTIWDIVESVDPLKRIDECPLGLDAHGTNLCPLHRRLDAALEMVERSFRETTIEDLLSAPGSVTPLCTDAPVTTIEELSAKTKVGKSSRKPS